MYKLPTPTQQPELRTSSLAVAVPGLKSLMIDVEESSGIAVMRYKKRYAIDHAPRTFLLKCNDERCENGGYDITQSVVGALRVGVSRSRGDAACYGTTGSADCSRSIRYEVFAEYEANR